MADQYDPNSQQPYQPQGQNPYAAAQQQPYIQPQENPYAAAQQQQQPYQAQENPYAAQQQNPYANQAQQPYQQQPYQQQQYQQPGSVPPQYGNQNLGDQSTTATNIIGGIAGFLIPLAGWILFFVWKNSRPTSAKIAGIVGLISFVLALIINFSTGAFS